MMQYEFEELIGKPVKYDDYNIIEKVYTFYPGHFNKKLIAEMYEAFGMRIFKDLNPVAQEFMDMEKELATARGRLRALEECYQQMKEGVI